MGNVSGTGKPIKVGKELTRAKRINSCLNKCIRNYLCSKDKEELEKNNKRLKHWQKLTFNFYEVYDVELVNKEDN